MANKPTQLAWRFLVHLKVGWPAMYHNEKQGSTTDCESTRHGTPLVCSSHSASSKVEERQRRVYGRPGLLTFWRGASGWLIRLTFRPFVWIRRSITTAAVLSAVMYPTLAANQDLPTTTSPSTFVATISARELLVRSVYQELSPRMKHKLEPEEVRKVSEAIIDECNETGVDHLFIIAIIEAESNFDIEAVSPTGARGLMQIMPGTFREVSNAKRMFDPVNNVRAGIRYVKKLYTLGFTTPWDVLLGYNQGPSVVISVWKKKMPMPDEAKAYIPNVMAKYRILLSKAGKNPNETKKYFMASR